MPIPVVWIARSAKSGDTYDIERDTTGDEGGFVNVVTDQLATTPFTSPSTTLVSDVNYGDDTIGVVDATGFQASGYASFNDALVTYTLNGNTLESVVWITGYGLYTAGTTIWNAHETWSDPDETLTLNTIRYRIYRKSGGKTAHPAEFTHYPAKLLDITADQIILVVPLIADVQWDTLIAYDVKCVIEADDEQVITTGELIKKESGVNDKVTLADGTTLFAVWSSSARQKVSGGAPGNYIVTITLNNAETRTIIVPEIPTQSDRDTWLITELI